jgi:ATP-dependent protease Clp ATPase subunit
LKFGHQLARKTSGNRASEGSRDIGGEGVQQALLRMMEGSSVTIHAKGLPENVWFYINVIRVEFP